MKGGILEVSANKPIKNLLKQAKIIKIHVQNILPDVPHNNKKNIISCINRSS